MDRSAIGPSREFDTWLQDAVIRSSPSERIRHLEQWSAAPSARIAHPQEDHLLPLMVAVGAAENEAGSCVYHEDDFMGTMSVSSFRFGA
jgi:aromatic ring-opening dioxygenase catalytic subunit (LigB family)